MKLVLENRTRNKINTGSMKTVFEKRSAVILSGTPGGSGGSGNFRILEDNDFRITESGDFRILE